MVIALHMSIKALLWASECLYQAGGISVQNGMLVANCLLFRVNSITIALHTGNQRRGSH